MTSLHQIVYYIQRYSISTLYPTSSNKLSIDYPTVPESVTTLTVPASTTQLLQEFKSSYGIILLPDIYRVKVDSYASGNQSTTRAKIAIQFLINDTIVFTSPFIAIPYTNSPGTLWFDAYLPGMKETDQLTLQILANNTHTNSQTNTFYLYLHECHTYIKK